MLVEFDNTFEKSIRKIKDKSLFPKIEKVISLLEATDSLLAIASIKKMSGFKTYYCITDWVTTESELRSYRRAKLD